MYKTGQDVGYACRRDDTTKAYANRVIKKPDVVVNRTFVQMMEAPGYDIELTYVKRRITKNNRAR